jgi:hypothetical protein
MDQGDLQRGQQDDIPSPGATTTSTTAPSAMQQDSTLPRFEHQLHPLLEPSPSDNSALLFSHKAYPPPAYTQHHEPVSLSFPDVPKTELPPIQSQSDVATGANNTLPSLSSVTGPQPHLYQSPRSTEPSYSPPPSQPAQWPSLNPLTTYYTPSHVQTSDSPQRMDVDVNSSGRASSVTLDDPDVRMAAEALGDLRAGQLDIGGCILAAGPLTSPRLRLFAAKGAFTSPSNIVSSNLWV